LAASDALVLLPRQWTVAPMFSHVMEAIPVKERLLAPDIVLIARVSVPLTPLAEHLAVLLQRESGVPYGERKKPPKG
jgi:hypothetical protein